MKIKKKDGRFQFLFSSSKYRIIYYLHGRLSDEWQMVGICFWRKSLKLFLSSLSLYTRVIRKILAWEKYQQTIGKLRVSLSNNYNTAWSVFVLIFFIVLSSVVGKSKWDDYENNNRQFGDVSRKWRCENEFYFSAQPPTSKDSNFWALTMGTISFDLNSEFWQSLERLPIFQWFLKFNSSQKSECCVSVIPDERTNPNCSAFLCFQSFQVFFKLKSNQIKIVKKNVAAENDRNGDLSRRVLRVDQGLQRGVGRHPLPRRIHLLRHPRATTLQLANKEAGWEKENLVRIVFGWNLNYRKIYFLFLSFN